MLFSRLVGRLKTRFYWLRRQVALLIFERRYGIETSAEIPLEELGLAHPDRVRYRPSEWRTLRRILRAGEVGPGDVFVDFGSGMGRVLLEAAEYPFGRVVGVELSQELSDIASRNVERRISHLRCKRVEVVTADAVDYPIPDDLTVAYLANPFGGEIFSAVVDNLISSFERHPREIRVIYNYVREETRLLDTGRVRKVREGRRFLRRWSHTDDLAMYVIVQADANPAS
jgi:SAM-dependent methyltransferase